MVHAGSIDIRLILEWSDREAIARITASSHFFSPDEERVALEVFEEALASPNSGYHFVLAQQAGRVVGYGCWGPIALTAGSADLYWLAVDDAVRGQGIGHRLLAALEQEVLAAGRWQLFVETSGRRQYAPTRHFYAGCGYRRVATFRNFYAPGDDKVVYVKLLGEPSAGYPADAPLVDLAS